MVKDITEKEYKKAVAGMEKLLVIVTKKGGFESLSAKENKLLESYTEKVRIYEDTHCLLPMPHSLQGILKLKMYEHQLKQKEMARMLNTSSTQLSEIIHNKRKPTLAFIKSLNKKFGVDGNLLLKVV